MSQENASQSSSSSIEGLGMDSFNETMAVSDLYSITRTNELKMAVQNRITKLQSRFEELHKKYTLKNKEGNYLHALTTKLLARFKNDCFQKMNLLLRIRNELSKMFPHEDMLVVNLRVFLILL